MHHFRTDPDIGLFLGTFSGPTTAADFARGLRLCFSSSENRVAAVWDIADMQVSFDIAEIRHLFGAVAQQDLPNGKMAFVVGTSEFSKSLVTISGAMRPNKRLGWQSFPTLTAAKAWVISPPS